MSKPKTPATKPPSPEKMEESLSTIFRDDEGKMPDMTKLEERRSSPFLKWGLGIGAFLLVLILAAWTGFLFFNPFRGFKGQGLELQIDGPQNVTLGEQATYFVYWKNAASEPLASADVRVSFPTDFSVTNVDPAATGDGLVWRLGSVAYNGRGTITVRGVFTGALGTKTAIQAVGTYRPASFNSDFEALATRALEYSSSVLTGTITVPEKVLPGDKIRVAYVVQNTGLQDVTGLEARITLPEGFVRDSTSSSALDERTVRIPIGTIAANASSTVTVTGMFATGHAGPSSIHAELGRVSADGSFQATQKTDAAFQVLSGDLSLSLVVNGSDKDRSIGFGDTLRFAIGYQNTATEELKDVSIKLHLLPLVSSGTTPVVGPVPSQGVFVDWPKAQDTASGTVSGNTISWQKEQLGVLERLTPNQDGTIEFSVPALASASGTTITGFQAVVEATMSGVGGTVVNRTIATAPITFRFRTDADATVEARYYSEEGAPFGTGPLPPVSGQTTRYRILWSLSKSAHALKDIRLSAPLPSRVAWVEKSMTTAGDIHYDDSTRTVTWTLNRLPSDVGEADASFDLDLTPTDLDIGRFAALLGDTHIEMTDADINEVIVRNKPALNTNLQNDEGAKLKGVVKGAP